MSGESAERSDTYHVYPLSDRIEHQTDGTDCMCGPRTEPVERDDGSIGWLVVHHSLDGREARERAAALAAEELPAVACGDGYHYGTWEPTGCLRDVCTRCGETRPGKRTV